MLPRKIPVSFPVSADVPNHVPTTLAVMEQLHDGKGDRRLVDGGSRVGDMVVLGNDGQRRNKGHWDLVKMCMCVCVCVCVSALRVSREGWSQLKTERRGRLSHTHTPPPANYTLHCSTTIPGLREPTSELSARVCVCVCVCVCGEGCFLVSLSVPS